MRRWTAMKAWVALVVASVLVAGCGKNRGAKHGTQAKAEGAASAGAKGSGGGAGGGEQVLGIPGGGPEFIDPILISESAGGEIAQNIFEPLLNWPPGDGDPQPGVAKSWEVSPDGLTYTFHLRDDARWSDGKPVTAEDFRWTWLKKLDPATGSRSAEHLWYIRGAKAFNEGKVKDPKTVGIEVPDPHTLVVHLENPLPYFVWFVATPHYAPVPRWVYEKYGKQWTRPEHIVSNGPYVLAEWAVRDRIVLERNEKYWDREHVRIPKVIYYETESETTALHWYDQGKVQWVPGLLPAYKVREFRAKRRPDFHLVPILCVYYYGFRTDKKPFDDPRIRRAFSMAMDRERLVEQVLGGGQIPATHIVPNWFEKMGYHSPEGPGFDPEGAKKALAEAGYPNGAGLPPVELVYNTFEGHRLIAEFYQRSVKENLGVELAVHNMEWKSLLKKISAGDFQMTRMGWCSMRDPYEFLKIFESDSPNNTWGYRNPELDRTLAASLRERDQHKRFELLRKAEAMILRDVPVMPIYFYTRPYLLKPNVCGLEDNPDDTHLIKYMYFSDHCDRGVNARAK